MGKRGIDVESDLVIFGDFYLGRILFRYDSKGRYSMKYSAGAKMDSLDVISEPDRYDSSIGERVLSKTVPSGMSLEYSYKFEDQKLEYKTEIAGGSIERTLYDVDLPATAPLFMLRVSKDMGWRKKGPLKNPLYLDRGLHAESLAIAFSLPGENGDGWSDALMEGSEIVKLELDIPKGIQPPKFFIMTAEDRRPWRSTRYFTTWVPETHHPTKITGKKSS